MSYRELIRDIVLGCVDLDKEVNIRILTRDNEGCVSHVQIVEVSRYNTTHDQLSVEMSSINLAEVKETK